MNENKCSDKKNKIAMIHSIPELKISSDEAESLGREDERRLLANRRLVLLVDLWFEVLTWMCIISPVDILTHPCLAVRKFTVIIVTILK